MSDGIEGPASRFDRALLASAIGLIALVAVTGVFSHDHPGLYG